MEATYYFLRKYFISTILILILFFVLNVVAVVGVLLFANNHSSNSEISVKIISNHISVNNQGDIIADDTVRKILDEKQAWAMLLDEDGLVIWQNNMPKDLPTKYTATDIAKFSRWYLEEYPTYVYEHLAGLLVIGGAPNSLVKWHYTMDTQYTSLLLGGIVFVGVANIFLMLLLFWRNIHRVQQAITPILHGIEKISEGQGISLPEKGELAQINYKLNKASNHLLKREQARVEWINGISHDVRTPLAIMLGYASEIEEDKCLPEKIKGQAGMIRQQGIKLRQLITDLNLASKLEYAMQPLHIDRIYPLELVRQVISDYLNEGLDEKYSFNLLASSKLDTLVIQGDYALLTRLLDNLIGNAICHNPNGCHLVIKIENHSNRCIISVIDDGVGMGAEQLDTLNHGVFTKKTDQATGETAHGLGLQLAKQIIQAHHGDIHFEQGIPNGLKVCISIPINQCR